MEALPSPETVVQSVGVGGPIAILCFTGMVFAIRYCIVLLGKIEKLHQEYAKELRDLHITTLNALNQSTLASSTGSANSEAVKASLDAILSYISASRNRRERV